MENSQRADSELSSLRWQMVDEQIYRRGVRSQEVIEAMRRVPREHFLPPELAEFAYDDTPLPIDEGQTISQPYIVAVMTEALELEPGDRVLEIGTGSGYAAAVLSEIVAEVFTVERHGQLATRTSDLFSDLGYANIQVLHGDGTLGWPEHAPYDAIVVTAGGPEIPPSLREQLKIGGRMVIPVGTNPRAQELIRITRLSETRFEQEDIADVRFVPLIGSEGWLPEREVPPAVQRRVSRPPEPDRLSRLIADNCQPLDDVDTFPVEDVLQRVGDARVVLIGEASHGTSEFYRVRAALTRALIEQKGFDFVAIEGDWPDAAQIDRYVRTDRAPPSTWAAFARFPTWMWRNTEVREFVDWLNDHNESRRPTDKTAFYGLDIYSLYTSINAILEYLDDVDPKAAATARLRYGCLKPWQSDPAVYGRAALSGHYRSCEEPVVHMLVDILKKRESYSLHDGERYFDILQNAKVAANAERYYRTMYYGSRASWNLRDTHMFDTLVSLLKQHGPDSKALVWAHNSHVGDATATEMSSRGEINIGELCRREFKEKMYNIGFGTHSGTVAAASDWNGPMEIKTVRPAIEGSYEDQCHGAAVPNFTLGLRGAEDSSLIGELTSPRLQRAIGVIYRPETELASHYFQAVLPRQFDEYIWIDKSSAVNALQTHELQAMPDTYPFGL